MPVQRPRIPKESNVQGLTINFEGDDAYSPIMNKKFLMQKNNTISPPDQETGIYNDCESFGSKQTTLLFSRGKHSEITTQKSTKVDIKESLETLNGRNQKNPEQRKSTKSSVSLSLTEKKLNNYLQQAKYLISSGDFTPGNQDIRKKESNYSIDNVYQADHNFTLKLNLHSQGRNSYTEKTTQNCSIASPFHKTKKSNNELQYYQAIKSQRGPINKSQNKDQPQQDLKSNTFVISKFSSNCKQKSFNMGKSSNQQPLQKKKLTQQLESCIKEDLNIEKYMNTDEMNQDQNREQLPDPSMLGKISKRQSSRTENAEELIKTTELIFAPSQSKIISKPNLKEDNQPQQMLTQIKKKISPLFQTNLTMTNSRKYASAIPSPQSKQGKHQLKPNIPKCPQPYHKKKNSIIMIKGQKSSIIDGEDTEVSRLSKAHPPAISPSNNSTFQFQPKFFKPNNSALILHSARSSISTEDRLVSTKTKAKDQKERNLSKFL